MLAIMTAGTGFASDSLYVPRFKSPVVGVEVSVLSTIVPVAAGLAINSGPGTLLMALGPAFGPSAGHFYAHQWGAGCLGIGLRLGIAGAAYWAMIPWLSTEAWNITVAIGLVGAGLLTAESIIEIAMVPGSVRSYNDWVLKKSLIDLRPEIDPRTRSFGIKICYNF